jgi:hypothetical protein
MLTFTFKYTFILPCFSYIMRYLPQLWMGDKYKFIVYLRKDVYWGLKWRSTVFWVVCRDVGENPSLRTKVSPPSSGNENKLSMKETEIRCFHSSAACFCCLFAYFTFRPWRWRQCIPQTLCSLSELHVTIRSVVIIRFLSLQFRPPTISIYVNCYARGSVMVKALCYKPEGRGFDNRWGDFLIYLILPAALGPRVYSASNRNEYQKHKNNNVSGE